MGQVTEREQIEALFAALAANRVDKFLAGCSEQLLVTLWGTRSASTTICPDRIHLWWEGFNHLADDTLVTEVLMTLTDDVSHEVILRHTFVRAGVFRKFETVNFCTLRGGVLAAWFSRPLNQEQYTEAWGLREFGDPSTRATGCSQPAATTIVKNLERK